MALEAWEGISALSPSTLRQILPPGTERKDSLWDKLMDRIQGHSPFISSSRPFWKDLQFYSKMAGTLIESTKDPKWEVGRKAGKGTVETGGGA